jgi:preprotein translocase subunit SecG
MSEGGWTDLLMLVLLGVVLVLVGLILARRTKGARARRTRDRR